MSGCIQKWVVQTSFKLWVFSGTRGQKLTVDWHWLKFFKASQFRFYSRQVCDKRLSNWIAITDFINDEWMSRNAKHGFNSWKWSNLTWSSSNSVTIYFCILPHPWFCLFAKSVRFLSDIGKMIEGFW